MSLSSQIILVASLFVVFAVLNLLVHLRGAGRRRPRHRRRRAVDTAFADRDPQAEADVEHAGVRLHDEQPAAPATLSPTVLLVIGGVIVACGVVVALLVL